MNYIFNFPDIGEGLDEGTILEIYVKVGQTVKSGDLLVNMETDKVTTDIPSPRSGRVLKIFGEVGDIIKVGTPLVELEMEGAGADSPEPAQTPAAEEEEAPAGVVGTLELAGSDNILPASNETATVQAKESEEKSLATPKVRATAKALNLDINEITGTGPAGRVVIEDLEKFITSKGQITQTDFARDYEEADVTFKPLSQIRKSIARNMITSKHNAAHVTIFEDVEVTELIAIRAKLKEAYAERGARLTYLPFIVKATVLALKKHIMLNTRIEMENNRMVIFNRFNIGIAMDTPEGLVVPVIRDADKLSIFQITEQITDFTARAMERKLTMEDMKHGTFTITNFGSISGKFGTPVINYPQVGILGIGRISKQPVVKNDEVAVGHVLGLSLTVDHRVIDGGETARFTKSVIDYLSEPLSLLME